MLMEQNKKNPKVIRQSGIELLKIIAILMIVITHVVDTLCLENPYVLYDDYLMNLSLATMNFQQFVLIIMCYFGEFANNIFFICSAWFLLDSKKVNKKKIIKMLADVWMISVVILGIIMILDREKLSLGMTVKSIFPTIFSNNWYITAYFIFYPFHTILNDIIYKVSQKALLKICLFLLVLTCGINFVLGGGYFYVTNLFLWFVLYFTIGYIKLHLNNITSSVRFNIFTLLIGILGNLGIIYLTNFLGLRINFFENKMLYWDKNFNPFILLTAISLLNIVRNIDFKNLFINKISSLSLLVYVIHENILLRTYYRPYIFHYIYNEFGYDYIILWVLGIATILFIVSIFVSIIYQNTLQKIVTRVVEWCYPHLENLYSKFETIILKID